VGRPLSMLTRFTEDRETMAGTSGWAHREPARRDAERGAALADWIDHELRPFSPWWAERLQGLPFKGLDDLRAVPILTEAEAAAAGGAGNPGLLLLPTEDGFKRHAGRGELWRAARELRGGGEAARRAALFRRYKPVHVHEAGVAVVLAVAYTRSDLDRLHLAGARLLEVLGLGADDRLVSAVPAGPSIRFWGLYHAALAGRMTALHLRAAGEGVVGPAMRGLAMLPATVLAVPVHEAEELLDGLHGRALPELRTVLTVGPPPDVALRTRLAEAAATLAGGHVRVQAVWAPECARALWGEPRPASADPAEATYGLHTYPDLEVLEVRDVEQDRMAGEGAPGELVYTSLGWRGTATVRLATGSWVGGLVTTAPCPLTGATVPRVAPQAVDGAWQPRVDRGDGRRVRVDLREAPKVIERAGLDGALRDWSLRAEGDRLVLAVDAAEREVAWRVGQAVASALGVSPDLLIGAAAAAARPRLGRAEDAVRVAVEAAPSAVPGP
jgi:hypothetical protein